MKIRKGQDDVQLTEAEFKQRMRERFFDPNFQAVDRAVEQVLDVAFKNYEAGRKAPLTSPAGEGYKDPAYKLSDQWRETRERLITAEAIQKNPASKSRLLIICASPRNEHTCPGEVSKTFRLAKIAQAIVEAQPNFECEFLDLSRLAAEYGKNIFPCKACVSTAMPLCHWPCSCYPNNSLGQVNDWMAEIYEMWVRAHGVMILTPVHWYQAPAALKLMIDRLVCADGGNPDPTSTKGKNPEEAKKLELTGWDYPKHLNGRAFSVVVHGDTTGVDGLRRNLVDWLTDMQLIAAGPASEISRYIGYYEPYATSHDDLDKDDAFQAEVKLAASGLIECITSIRNGTYKTEFADSIRKK